MGEVWPEVACTAHRRLDRDATAWAAGRLAGAVVWLRDQGMTHGHCGMAAGGDLLWAEALTTAGVRWTAHVPYPQQPDWWPQVDRARWRSLLECAAAGTVVYGDLDAVPAEKRAKEAPRLLHARNDGMLDRSQAVVALWSPGRPRGGTWSAVRKAGLRGLPVIWLDPDARTTKVIGPAEIAELVKLAPVPQHARR